jgi:hypothetical protein
MFPKAQHKSMKQKKQIVIEEEETVVLRSSERSTAEFCPLCGESVVMATPWVAATLNGATEREMFRMIERGMIYVTEGERILMCLRCVGRVSMGTSRPPTDITPINREPERILGSSDSEEI